MSIRGIILILVIGLCLAFVAEFLLHIYEVNRISELCARTSEFQFPCHYVPQHPVALLHLLSFVLLLTVAFARSYYLALAVAAGYLAADILGLYWRLGTGFYGGNTCPEGRPCLAAIRRATWFDWTALVILAVSIVLIAWSILHKRREV